MGSTSFQNGSPREGRSLRNEITTLFGFYLQEVKIKPTKELGPWTGTSQNSNEFFLLQALTGSHSPSSRFQQGLLSS